MLDTVNGLPTHALVVHAVVVLVPLAVAGAVLIAVRPAWRRRYGSLVALLAVLATALCPVATSSGESLEHRVGDPGAHAALGDQLVFFMIPLTVLVLALWWLQRRADGAARRPGRALGVLAVLSVVAAVAAGVQVVRVGDSGAKAVWADQVNSTAQGQPHHD